MSSLHDYLFYEEPGIQLYCGDCREMVFRADAVITDPPYNVGLSYLSHNDHMQEAEYLSWLRSCFTLATANSSCLVWFWQGMRVANGEARACLPDGFKIHHLGAWFKREFAGDLYKGEHPAFSWEPIIWATNGPAKYYGPKGGHAGRDLLIGNSPRHEGYGGKNGHPAPKPISVVRTVVSWVTAENQTVIDPFMGSGTVIQAAKDLGRKAIGIEIEPKYCELAVKRLRQEVLALET